MINPFILLFSYQQLKYQIDPEYLFSPINGEGKAERALVEQYFKVNYTHRFNVGRITRPGKFQQQQCPQQHSKFVYMNRGGLKCVAVIAKPWASEMARRHPFSYPIKNCNTFCTTLGLHFSSLKQLCCKSKFYSDNI